MAKKEKKTPETDQIQETPVEETAETPVEEAPEQTPEVPEVDPWEEKYNAEHDAHLRLAADYDNFRKRTAREKEASYGNGKADAVEKLLPVYDNLERALNQPTEDTAYKKGVEIFGNVGDAFDPNIHNAVMHIEDENLAENTIAQVFQKGFKMGEKIVRFAMVQVAN